MIRKDNLVRLTLFVLFVLAVFILLVAGRILGWDFLGWFSSPDSTWLYLMIGIFLFISAGLLVREWVNKL